ncbi:hypothetical protein KKB18_09415, partial [bacterium]|nr:hypothetical protein [bacterium]
MKWKSVSKLASFVLFTLLILVFNPTFLSARTITVEYHFDEPELRYNPDGSTDIFIDDTISYAEVGKPILPMKTAKILIPRDASVTNISVLKEKEIVLPGEYFINYGRTALPTGRDYPLEKYISTADPEI